MKIAVIDYGAGNLQSVCFAIERLGLSAIVTSDADVIRMADKVIFPGVGHARAAMQKLKAKKLDILIPKLEQPVLGICLGMQLLCKHSAEGNTPGLAVFDGEVIKFKEEKVPQVGWNTVFDLTTPLFKGIPEHEYVYMVHSYYAPTNKDTIAKTVYGVTYSAALQKDNFYGVQFHPEKSSEIGAQIITNFLNL